MPQYFLGHNSFFNTPSADLPGHALLGVIMGFHVKSCYEEDVCPSNHKVGFSALLTVILLHSVSLSVFFVCLCDGKFSVWWLWLSILGSWLNISERLMMWLLLTLIPLGWTKCYIVPCHHDWTCLSTQWWPWLNIGIVFGLWTECVGFLLEGWPVGIPVLPLFH